MFKSAKVGDKIWDYLTGDWCEIRNIIPTDNYPIKISAPSSGCTTCDYNGKDTLDTANPRYFWYPFEPPKQERPKKPVKKKVEYWLNLYHESAYGYATKEVAILAKDTNKTLCEPVHFVHEYEVEE